MEKKEFEIMTERYIDNSLDKREKIETSHIDIVLNEIEHFINGFLTPGVVITVIHNGCEITEYELDEYFDDVEDRKTLIDLYRSFICYFAEYVNEGNFDFDFGISMTFDNIVENIRIL